jgi:dipeptidyl aminopeptidase/acylaminoacyl peptidase
VRLFALLGVVFAASVGALLHSGSAHPLNCHANDAWQDRFPAWSPNGDTIAFVRQQTGCDPPAESIGFVAPGRAAQIYGADGRRTSWAPPSWAPGGLALAYGGDAESVRVTAPSGPVGDNGPGLFPSWAGNAIAVTVGSSLQLIELIVGTRRVLVPSYVKPTQSTGVAAWSPDGRWLALGVMSTTVEGGAIAVVRADGSDFRLLAHGLNQSVNPTWSPDGETIAFETNRDRNFEIYSVRLDGTQVRNLTQSPQGDDRMPAWHGSTIAFISNRDRRAGELYGFSLFTMTGEGRAQTWRAGDLHPYSAVAWSPDGSRIAFASGRECLRWGIYVVQLADDSVQRLTNQCSFNGTSGDDVMRGTPFKDFIHGEGGRDVIDGLGGPDLISGGLARDHLDGGPGNDILIGGRSDDVVLGGDGNDRISTDDRGHDRVFGGRGDDLIESGSGSRDVIVCGPGRDTVVADRLDRVARDCERVRRQ